MAMNPRLLRPRATAALVAVDADARTYINAVRTADGGQYMEAGVQRAIDAFIIGCKADGIWSAIKASCILMGARTLSGALTPLVGSAPTNVNFVAGDYNRKTGLVGDGTTKYLNTNRANNADPQDSKHLAVHLSSAAPAIGTSIAAYLSADGGLTSGTSTLNYTSSNASLPADALIVRLHNDTATGVASVGLTSGFKGISRSASADFVARASGSDSTVVVTSQAPTSRNMFVFAQNAVASTVNYSAARLTFYSIGESLTLSLLDSRVTTLYNAIGAAIP